MIITGKEYPNECKICGEQGISSSKRMCVACFKFIRFGRINLSQTQADKPKYSI